MRVLFSRTFSRARPTLKRAVCEARQPSFTREIQQRTKQVTQAGRAAEKVCCAGSDRCEFRPAVDGSKKVGVPRTPFALVVMREEFGAIGGDIHVGWAFRFTRLAGEAKIQGF